MPNKDGMRKLENVVKLVPSKAVYKVLLAFGILSAHLLGCPSSGSLWYHSFPDTTPPRPHLIFVPLMGGAGFAFKSTTSRILFVFCSYEHFYEF